MRPINRVILHCSGTTEGTFESIRKHHVEVNGWDDIGYHSLITTDGILHDGRPLSVIGAHCEGENKDSIGVCMVGVDKFTIKQIYTLIQHLKVLMLNFKLTPSDIYGHYEFPTAKKQGKTCPGFEISYFRGILSSNQTI